MNLGRVTVITPPDKFFNLDISYLLVKPSTSVVERASNKYSLNFSEANFIKYKLSRGEICVANSMPPCEWCKSGYLFLC